MYLFDTYMEHLQVLSLPVSKSGSNKKNGLSILLRTQEAV